MDTDESSDETGGKIDIDALPESHPMFADIERYLTETKVDNEYNNICHRLLSRKRLPYNPYPFLVEGIRHIAERETSLCKIDESTIARLRGPVQDSRSSSVLVHPENCDFVWGLRHIVEFVDPSKLSRFTWLLNDIRPSSDRLEASGKISMQVMTALVGPAVFLGSLYPSISSVDFRHEYLVVGDSLEWKWGPRVVELFAKALMKDIGFLNDHTEHVLLNANVPVFHRERGWINSSHTFETIELKRYNFIAEVSNAVTGGQYIEAECLFLVDPTIISYHKGTVQYALNVTHASTRHAGEESVKAYIGQPLKTLFEGIFLTQNEADSYAAMFSTSEYCETKAEVPLIDITGEGDDKSLDSENSRHNSAGPSNSYQISTMPPKKKILIGGFAMDNQPQHLDTLNRMREGWRKSVASNHSTSQLFDIIQNIILLAIHSSDDLLLIDVHRLLQGYSYRLNVLRHLNKTLTKLILQYEKDLGNSIAWLLRVVRDLCQSIADITGQQFAKNMLNQIDEIIDLWDKINYNVSEVSMFRKMGGMLKEVNISLYVAQISYTDSAMKFCSAIVTLIEESKTEFRDTHWSKKLMVTFPISNGSDSHFVAKEIQKQDSLYIAMSSSEKDKKHTELTGSARQTAILKYVTDTRMNEVWAEYLVELFLNSATPKNPYPSLLSTLRQAALRMELCYEDSTIIKDRVLQQEMICVDKANKIYTIPECEAYGLYPAFAMIDKEAWTSIQTMILEPLIHISYESRKGPYKVAVCHAIAGNSYLYGRTDPYLKTLTIDEHYFVKGPAGCSRQALQLHSNHVFAKLEALSRGEQFLVGGMCMGEQKWSMADVKKRRKEFAYVFEESGRKKEPLYIKLFASTLYSKTLAFWRIVKIEMHFKLHFVDDQEQWHESFYDEKPDELYSSVFADKKTAAFFVQTVCGISQMDPYDTGFIALIVDKLEQVLLKAYKDHAWFDAHRLLLIRNFILQKDSLVAEFWRLLHSAAGQLQFVISLARTVQELVLLKVEERSSQSDQPAFHTPSSHGYYSRTTKSLTSSAVGSNSRLYLKNIGKDGRGKLQVISRNSEDKMLRVPSKGTGKLSTVHEWENEERQHGSGTFSARDPGTANSELPKSKQRKGTSESGKTGAELNRSITNTGEKEQNSRENDHKTSPAKELSTDADSGEKGDRSITEMWETEMDFLVPMAYGFRSTALAALRRKSAMIPAGVIEAINLKLCGLFQKDANGKLEQDTYFKLDEVCSMINVLKDQLAFDVHSISPETMAALEEVKKSAGVPRRPASVASAKLDNPNLPPLKADTRDHLTQWRAF